MYQKLNRIVRTPRQVNIGKVEVGEVHRFSSPSLLCLFSAAVCPIVLILSLHRIGIDGHQVSALELEVRQINLMYLTGF